MIARIFLSSIVCFAFVAFSGADEVQTIAGKKVSGTLEKITDTEITLKTATGPVVTPMSQVLELFLRQGKTLPAAANYLELQLIDDSLLRATKVTFGAKDVQVDLTTGASIKVPVSALVSFVRDAQDAKLREQWTGLMKAKTREDRIFLLSEGNLNPILGALGAIDEKTQKISFKHTGGEIEPELTKLHGVHFVRVDLPAAQRLCKVIDVDGNELVATKLTCDGTNINLTTPFDAKVSIDVKFLAKIDFNFGKLTYLSDLDAKSPESILLGGFNPVRKNANLDGNPIMLLDKKYDKGLSMYAGAEVEYNLAGKYKEFKALLGADARIAEEGQGKVTVTIYCDKQKVMTKEVSTKGADPIALNVKDVNTLRIIVTGSNFTNYSGHATLANAHVSQ